MRTMNWVAIIWLCFVLRGLFYVTTWPVWEGFDEWAHFAVADAMKTQGRPIIDRNSLVSLEIQKSLELLPLPMGMTNIPPGGLRRDVYNQLSQDERKHRQSLFRSLSAEDSNSVSVSRLPAYEASQPPLYYWLLGIVFSFLNNVTLAERVWAARVVSLFIRIAYPPDWVFTRAKVFSKRSRGYRSHRCSRSPSRRYYQLFSSFQ